MDLSLLNIGMAFDQKIFTKRSYEYIENELKDVGDVESEVVTE